MNCPKCGKPTGPGAAFCMHCGQSLAAVQTAGGPPTGYAPAANPAFFLRTNSRKTTWLAIGTALAIVLAIVIGLNASGALRIGAKSSPLSSLRAQGNMPNQKTLHAEGQVPTNPLLRSEGSVGPSTLDRTDQRVTMPDDVRRWLEHLERIEKRKNDLSLQQLAQMSVLMQQMKLLNGMSGLLGEDGEDTPPTATAKNEFDDLRPEWNQLIADFRAYAPPAECKPIADDYYRALNEVPGITSDLGRILTDATSDPQGALQKLYKLQNTSTTVIDKYFGEADQKVGAICSKYETSKWFSIKTDVGGGLMSKFGI